MSQGKQEEQGRETEEQEELAEKEDREEGGTRENSSVNHDGIVRVELVQELVENHNEVDVLVSHDSLSLQLPHTVNNTPPITKEHDAVLPEDSSDSTSTPAPLKKSPYSEPLQKSPSAEPLQKSPSTEPLRKSPSADPLPPPNLQQLLVHDLY